MAKCRRLTMALAVVFLVMFCCPGCGDKKQESVDNRMTVATMTIGNGSVEKEVSYSGTIKGGNEVMVVPKATARVVGIACREGDRVSPGSVLMTLDSTDYSTGLASAEAALAQAEASWEAVGRNLARTRELFQQGAVSAQQMEQSELALTQAAALREQALAAVRNARNLLSNCQVTSPIGGVVGLIQASVGSMVSPQTPVAIISSLDKVRVTINVGEADINLIKQGSQATVRIDSLDGREYKGTVDKVAAVTDPRTRRFPVEVVIDNTDGAVKSGMFAVVRLATVRKDGVLVIPREALSEKGARRVVFTVDAKGCAVEHEVKTGIEGRERVEIISGLKAGDNIIIKGQTLIDDGEKVRVSGKGAGK